MQWVKPGWPFLSRYSVGIRERFSLCHCQFLATRRDCVPWPLCRPFQSFASLSTLGIGGLKAVGMMVHKPHMRQPCSTARSCLHVRHCFNWGSGQKWVGQPSRGRDSALAREGVLEVSLAISEADTEHRLICLLATWSISCSTYGYVLYWRNSLDSASAGDTGVYDLHSSS